MRVAIIYYGLLDEKGQHQRIGGVETYIVNLASLCLDLGWEVLVFQYGAHAFTTRLGDVIIKGVQVAHLSNNKKKLRLWQVAQEHIDPAKDLVIFAADHISIRTRSQRALSIQHGVAWDLHSKYLSQNSLCKYPCGSALKKIKARRDAIRRFDNCGNRVCVDYNFFNWYRTMTAHEPVGNIWIIPNSAPILSQEELATRTYEATTRVLFARRFVEFRGTRLFAEVVKRLLEQNQHIKFTFAGEGPDENWLQAVFAQEERVTITKYLPRNSKQVLLSHDIAVIPSLASEGTSLSVAEAMGAGCAVVATCVGGITNMIIDGYNGLLAMPVRESLFDCVYRLATDTSLRQRLGSEAWRCACTSFSIERWREKWRSVLEQVSQVR